MQPVVQNRFGSIVVSRYFSSQFGDAFEDVRRFSGWGRFRFAAVGGSEWESGVGMVTGRGASAQKSVPRLLSTSGAKSPAVVIFGFLDCIFGLLERARETRFPVTKITFIVTPGGRRPWKTRRLCVGWVPKTLAIRVLSLKVPKFACRVVADPMPGRGGTEGPGQRERPATIAIAARGADCQRRISSPRRWAIVATLRRAGIASTRPGDMHMCIVFPF